MRDWFTQTQAARDAAAESLKAKSPSLVAAPNPQPRPAPVQESSEDKARRTQRRVAEIRDAYILKLRRQITCLRLHIQEGIRHGPDALDHVRWCRNQIARLEARQRLVPEIDEAAIALLPSEPQRQLPEEFPDLSISTIGTYGDPEMKKEMSKARKAEIDLSFPMRQAADFDQWEILISARRLEMQYKGLPDYNGAVIVESTSQLTKFQQLILQHAFCNVIRIDGKLFARSRDPEAYMVPASGLRGGTDLTLLDNPGFGFLDLSSYTRLRVGFRISKAEAGEKKLPSFESLVRSLPKDQPASLPSDKPLLITFEPLLRREPGKLVQAERQITDGTSVGNVEGRFSKITGHSTRTVGVFESIGYIDWWQSGPLVKLSDK
jgi:hypothetical protein